MTDRISSWRHCLSSADLFWHLIILKHHCCYFFSQTLWIDAVFCFHPLELHLTTAWCSYNWLLSAVYEFSVHNSFAVHEEWCSVSAPYQNATNHVSTEDHVHDVLSFFFFNRDFINTFSLPTHHILMLGQDPLASFFEVQGSSIVLASICWC